MVCDVIKVLSIDYNFTFGKHMIEFFRKGMLSCRACGMYRFHIYRIK